MKPLFSALLSGILLCSLFSFCQVRAVTESAPADLLLNPQLSTVLDQYNGSFRIRGKDTENLLAADGYAYTDWRGSAISPDGRYAFAGYLGGGTGAATYMIDLKNGGKVTDFRIYRDKNGYAQPKGLAMDDRGNLYTGLTFSNNFNLVSFDIAKVDMQGACLTPITQQPVTVCAMGTPGDTEGVHMGINGICAVRIGEKYYLYIAVNYRIDRLYRFDVTDPRQPTPDLSFGTNGYLDFQAPGAAALSDRNNLVSVREAYYMDCAADGAVYLCAQITGGSLPCGILKITPDGKIEAVIEAKDAYAIAIYGSYAFVTAKHPAQSGFMAAILRLSQDHTQIALIQAPPECGSISYATVKNDILYIVDSGTDHTASHLYAAGLTTSAQAALASLLGCESDETTDSVTAAAVTSDLTPEEDVSNRLPPESQTASYPTTATDISESAADRTAVSENQFLTNRTETTADSIRPTDGCGSALSLLPVGIFVCVVSLYLQTRRKTRGY